jgi:hypothetical protein
VALEALLTRFRRKPAVVDPLCHDIEQWLLHRGAPHFIEGYRATTNVWTRAFPALLALWVLGLGLEVGLVDDVRSVALLGALGVLAASWVLTNRLRKRSSFALPDSIGPLELALFAFTPGVLSYILDRDVSRALLSIAGGVTILVLLYFVTSYGLVSFTRYVLRNFGEQARLIGKLSSRAIPLLLLITMATFIGAESWQLSSRLIGASQVATLALFVIVGGLFLVSRVPGEVANVEQFHSWDDVKSVVADTPAANVALPPRGDPHEPERNRGQRINLLVMALATQAIQITLVAMAIYAFFVLLGIVAIPPATVAAWLGSPPHVLVSLRRGASTFALTSELLRVAGFLASFAGLSFTVYLVTDSTYREEFASDVSAELRKVLAVRVAYLHHLESIESPAGLKPRKP